MELDKCPECGSNAKVLLSEKQSNPDEHFDGCEIGRGNAQAEYINGDLRIVLDETICEVRTVTLRIGQVGAREYFILPGGLNGKFRLIPTMQATNDPV